VKPGITHFSVAYLHDPEFNGGVFAFFRALGFRGVRNPMRWSVSMFRLFLVSTLVFGSYCLFIVVYPSLQAVSIPQTALAITNTAKVYFNAEPASFAETGLMLLIFSVFMGLASYLVSRFRLPKAVFWVLGFVVVAPLIGGLWMGWHLIAYGGSEVSLFHVFLFGLMGSWVTLLIGSWIPWYTWHFWNNIFAELAKVAPANEDVIFVSVVVLVVLLIGLVVVEAWRWKHKRSVVVIEPVT